MKRAQKQGVKAASGQLVHGPTPSGRSGSRPAGVQAMTPALFARLQAVVRATRVGGPQSED